MYFCIQDSLSALEALREYGEQIANRHLFDMLLKLESTSTAYWKEDVRLSRGNFFQYSTHEVCTSFSIY